MTRETSWATHLNIFRFLKYCDFNNQLMRRSFLIFNVAKRMTCPPLYTADNNSGDPNLLESLWNAYKDAERFNQTEPAAAQHEVLINEYDAREKRSRQREEKKNIESMLRTVTQNNSAKSEDVWAAAADSQYKQLEELLADLEFTISVEEETNAQLRKKLEDMRRNTKQCWESSSANDVEEEKHQLETLRNKVVQQEQSNSELGKVIAENRRELEKLRLELSKKNAR
eukprot:PhF_6_TR19951/c2_g1_i3/m.29055